MSSNTLFVRSGGSFIDPENVGSGVNWRISVEGSKPKPPEPGEKKTYRSGGYVSVDGDVALSDCGRVINWSLSDATALEKIDNAIAELQRARRAMSSALRAADKFRTVHGIKDDE